MALPQRVTRCAFVSTDANITIPVLYAKIHRATVTDADLHYEGSLTIDAALMQAAGLTEFQKIEIYNITNGHRFQTYALTGPANSGTIQVNGAAAHLARTQDLLIIAAYADMPLAAARQWQPRLVFVDRANRPTDCKPDRLPIA